LKLGDSRRRALSLKGATMKPISKPIAGKSEETFMPTTPLSALCSEAADHVAKARLTLSDADGDADRALLHLDEAIFCLRRLLAHGRAAAANAARARPRPA
jgi:hypothetical protein